MTLSCIKIVFLGSMNGIETFVGNNCVHECCFGTSMLAG